MQGLKATIRRVSEVNDLEQAWRALEACADRSFFLSWDWAATAIEVGGADLLVAEISSPEGIVALGLLSSMTETRHGVLRSRQLRLNEIGPGAEHTVPVECNTLLATPGMEDASWDVLLAALNKPGAPLWDELIVTNALADVEARLRAKGVRLHRRSEYGSGFVDLAGLRAAGVETAAGYIATLGKSTRSQLNRSMKLYQQRGPLSLERAATPMEGLSYLEEIAKLHHEKWRVRGRSSLATAAHLLKFHRRLIKKTIERGGVELARLSAGGAPFAWIYNFVDDKRVLFNMGGFVHEDDNRLKPGLVAHAMLIERHLQAGRDVYDFLAGNDRYKLNLGQRGPDFTGFAIQRPTPALRLEGALRSVKHRTEALVETVRS